MKRWTHKHGSSQMALYWCLSSECVVVVVGNYKVCDFGLTRLVTISACTSSFVTGVESKAPPKA